MDYVTPFLQMPTDLQVIKEQLDHAATASQPSNEPTATWLQTISRAASSIVHLVYFIFENSVNSLSEFCEFLMGFSTHQSATMTLARLIGTIALAYAGVYACTIFAVVPLLNKLSIFGFGGPQITPILTNVVK